MFYTSPHPFGELAPLPQIVDEARIAHRLAAEPGGRHAGVAEEQFDSAQYVHGFSAP
jgi:hypothetical protein